MTVLVTGGAGYIGSHTIVELLENDHQVVVVDNLSNSKRTSLIQIERITSKSPHFYQLDTRDYNKLQTVFKKHHIEAVIHFAGLKAVSESVKQPLRYYQNNIDSTLTLLDVMQKSNVTKLVFSSSATVYGKPGILTETTPTSPTNPYGHTKLMIERILDDVSQTSEDWHIISLRYFNPIGAHYSGLIGEDPLGIPNNLVPYITQVASGIRATLRIFGNDYDTPDRTAIRDYIHVSDVARAHVSALEQLDTIQHYKAYNIGTGQGTSVLEMVAAFEQATGQNVPYQFQPRRSGDISDYYADPTLAHQELGWQAIYTIADACRDAWSWQVKNPNGFNVQTTDQLVVF